jgi:hypothetical protein
MSVVTKMSIVRMSIGKKHYFLERSIRKEGVFKLIESALAKCVHGTLH